MVLRARPVGAARRRIRWRARATADRVAVRGGLRRTEGEGQSSAPSHGDRCALQLMRYAALSAQRPGQRPPVPGVQWFQASLPDPAQQRFTRARPARDEGGAGRAERAHAPCRAWTAALSGCHAGGVQGGLHVRADGGLSAAAERCPQCGKACHRQWGREGRGRLRHGSAGEARVPPVELTDALGGLGAPERGLLGRRWRVTVATGAPHGQIAVHAGKRERASGDGTRQVVSGRPGDGDRGPAGALRSHGLTVVPAHRCTPKSSSTEGGCPTDGCPP